MSHHFSVNVCLGKSHSYVVSVQRYTAASRTEYTKFGWIFMFLCASMVSREIQEFSSKYQLFIHTCSSLGAIDSLRCHPSFAEEYLPNV